MVGFVILYGCAFVAFVIVDFVLFDCIVTGSFNAIGCGIGNGKKNCIGCGNDTGACVPAGCGGGGGGGGVGCAGPANVEAINANINSIITKFIFQVIFLLLSSFFF